MVATPINPYTLSNRAIVLDDSHILMVNLMGDPADVQISADTYFGPYTSIGDGPTIDRFVQISTDEICGKVFHGAFSEEDSLDPRNPYAATKAGADLLALSYHVTHDLPVVVTRSSNNFGPRQHPEKLIPKLISRASQGEPLPIYGDGTNVREWTYVEDNCRAIALLLDKGPAGEVYNVGSGHELQNIEVARRIVDSVSASEDLIEFVEDRPGHDQRYALETDKIETLGWEPQWSFDEGLTETINYYRAQQISS